MAGEPVPAQQAFSALAAQLNRAVGSIEEGTLFNRPALTRRGATFAVLAGDRLAVRLSAQDAQRRIEAGEGESFDATNSGHALPDWLLGSADQATWSRLAQTALAYVM